MKKYFLLPLMAAALIFTGCDEDDDDNGGNGGGSEAPASIVATWELVSVTYFVEIGDVGEFSETLAADNCNPKPETIFNADGTVTTVNFEIDSNEECEVLETLEGTYEEMEGDDKYLLTLEENGQEEQEEVEILLSDENNTLRIIFEDGDGEYRTRWIRQ